MSSLETSLQTADRCVRRRNKEILTVGEEERKVGVRAGEWGYEGGRR